MKFQVDGLGYMCLEEKTSQADLETLMVALAALAPTKTLHCENTSIENKAMLAAAKAGFQVVIDL